MYRAIERILEELNSDFNQVCSIEIKFNKEAQRITYETYIGTPSICEPHSQQHFKIEEAFRRFQQHLKRIE
jgi:hypothetical protein